MSPDFGAEYILCTKLSRFYFA